MVSICTVKDCEYKHLAKGYCSKHYYRIKRGQSLTDKSRFDRRPGVVRGDTMVIELANGKGKTTVDLDFSNLDKHNWSLSGDGYPMTYIKGKLYKIHHLVIGKPPTGKVVDHIDRNRLNNRLSNLRFVTQKENILNSENKIQLNWKTT